MINREIRSYSESGWRLGCKQQYDVELQATPHLLQPNSVETNGMPQVDKSLGRGVGGHWDTRNCLGG